MATERWDDRIDEMERRGQFTPQDAHAMCNFHTCLVGEALRDAVAPTWYALTSGHLKTRLAQLGAFDHPVLFLSRRDWLALRARLAEIRAVVAEYYPPPQLFTPSESEPARELVEAK